VKLDIVRNGAAQTVNAKVGVPRAFCPAPGICITNEGPQRVDRPGEPMPDVPRVFEGMNSPMLGIEAESIEGQLAWYFGSKDPSVLVRTVLHNSAAERAGLKAGDVILRVDDGKVASAADISARLRATQGKSVQLALLRDHKEISIAVLPETGDHPVPAQH
jgi:serine protease Do